MEQRGQGSTTFSCSAHHQHHQQDWQPSYCLDGLKKKLNAFPSQGGEMSKRLIARWDHRLQKDKTSSYYMAFKRLLLLFVAVVI